MSQSEKVFDQRSRPLRDLRISVTDKCNFRCTYCMPSELFGPDYPFLTREEILSFEEVERLASIFVNTLGVRKIRITGGEPLMRKGLPILIKKLSNIQGIRDIAMTSNGVLLPRYALELKKAGLNRVSISLDSLNDELFGKINGKGISVKSVLDGIQAAKDAGLQVKVNMVVKRGMNEKEVVPMARFFKEHGHILRFIEFMDVGNTNQWCLDDVYSKQQILHDIHQEMPLEPIEANYTGEVATRYRYVGSTSEIGIISSVTDAFCNSCNRARISAEGKLYTCLFSSHGHDLRDTIRSSLSDENIANYIRDIWQGRSDQYSVDREQLQSKRKKVEMSHIGG